MKEISFSEVALDWLEDRRGYVKASTYQLYKYEVEEYLISEFENLPINMVTENKIQAAVYEWQNMSRRHGLNQSTVRNLVTILKAILKYANKKGYTCVTSIEIHYANSGEANKTYKDIRMTYLPDEQKAILQACRSNPDYHTFGIFLTIQTGIRIGELCALKWDNMDLQNRIVYIRQTLQRIYVPSESPKTRIIITPPKSMSSIRAIPLSGAVMEFIEVLPRRNEHGFILTNSDRFEEPRTYRDYYYDFLRSHSLSTLKFHALRHTFATSCIANGADYKGVSEILGHANINTTLNRYVHPSMDEKRNIVEIVNR